MIMQNVSRDTVVYAMSADNKPVLCEKIKNYYENYNEDGRLFRSNAQKTEYLTTIRYFDLLFNPNSNILDACAGTGRYSFYLADKGHSVTACDLSEHNVNIIKTNPTAHKLSDTMVCDVMDLSRFADNSFDVVLCMGALYHYPKDEDKRRAVSECVRICKKGGIVALAYLTEIGCIYSGLNEDAGNIGDLLLCREGKLEIGIFYATTPSAIENIATECGLKKAHNIGTDGIIYAAAEKLNKASDDNFNKYMEFHYSICENPDVVGTTLHGLWIGRKEK
jgi:2-polyprenyl-3-methyl-5-hydroxy-6-metoxy-1,4-benzoquinol methylase